jgi:peptide/nickel transport system substrate-binding protein
MAFDSLYTLAMRESDADRRYDLYRQADQTMLDNAVIMPIFYDENYRLLQKIVQNFDINAMEYRDFREVWLDPDVNKKEDAEQ